jgi:hemerythrin
MSDWFLWTPDLSVHVEKIDAQHRELFRRFNILAEAAFDGKGKEAIGESLQFLADYTIEHFGDEETFMKTYQFPDYTAHKQIHDAFVQDVKQFISSFESEQVTSNLVANVVQTLGDWTRDHIKGMDQQLGAFLQDKV